MDIPKFPQVDAFGMQFLGIMKTGKKKFPSNSQQIGKIFVCSPILPFCLCLKLISSFCPEGLPIPQPSQHTPSSAQFSRTRPKRSNSLSSRQWCLILLVRFGVANMKGATVNRSKCSYSVVQFSCCTSYLPTG